MKASQDLINENNYVLHETKEIRGKPNIVPENIEIIEELSEIHEIKEIKNEQKMPEIIKSNKNYEVQIKLEGEHAEIREEQNNCVKEDICPDCRNKEIIQEQNNDGLCNECRNECVNENIGEEQIQFGFVDAPFLEGNKEEEVIVNEDITNLIETIFEKLSNDDVLNDAHNLKITFNV